MRYLSALAGVGLTFLLMAPSVAPGIAGADEGVVPERGMFLIASRDLPDPNFWRTVVLLLHHDDTGTVGLIVNRRTGWMLSDLAPHVDGASDSPHRVYFGGPVAPERMTLLFRASGSSDAAAQVLGDVYFSAEQTVLEGLLAGTGNDLHVYAGHAGWGAGQLAHELSRGDWHLAAGEPRVLFSGRVETLWERLIEQYEPSGLLVRRAAPLRDG